MNPKRVLLIAAVLALVVTIITPASVAKASTNDDTTVAEKWIAAWNSHNPDKMLAAFTDDVFYEDVAFGEVSHGHAEFRKFAADEFDAVPDLELKLVRASIHNGHGTIEWSFSGTDKGIYKTGKKFTVRGVSVIDVRDGKISRSLDFYDSGTIMRQVGVLPAQ
ncbi:MAG: nuclear transport factor 2 family protein [Terriglobales bacterium]